MHDRAKESAMENARAEKKAALEQMTDFGIFYPRGHLVAAFRRREDAERVRRELMTGGYDDEDCLLYTPQEVAESTRRNLEDNRGPLSRLGRSDEAVSAHLRAAENGSTFLVIYAPGELEIERAMNVVRRTAFVFGHRYHRFAIQTLK
jgi:hypothetical protein